MSEIRIEIGGLHDIIEDLKDAKVRCRATECVNNSAWEGRNLRCLSYKCTLYEVPLDQDGKCMEYQTQDKRNKPEDPCDNDV